jgi:archaellum component FlaF (FlaF/FlaG flagellin family)
MQQITPTTVDISSNNTFVVEDCIAITFYNTGSYLVEVDGFSIRPGGQFCETVGNLTATLKHRYTILFTDDHTSTAVDVAQKQGRHIRVRTLKLC